MRRFFFSSVYFYIATFKCQFKYQVYLDIVNVKKFQQSLSRLRLSSHRLEIETGRWTKPEKTPLDNRKCKICMLLEDEYHFILECTLYKDLRKQYIKKYFWNPPNMPKFIQLCTSENRKTIRNLSIYIEKSFQLRKNHNIN